MNEVNSELAGVLNAILSCDDDTSAEAAEKAMAAGVEPDLLINTAISAIREVGNKFESGEIFLPELMLAGLGMEKVMGIAQQKMMERGETPKLKGTLLIGSVAGDLHTIGKNLVVTLWRANGYQVHDLGIDISAEKFLSSAQQLRADVVGLSALMSTTLVEQKWVIEHFERKGARERYKIIVGGGVCTQEWADEIGADGYAADAAKSVSLVSNLLSGSA